MSNCTPCTPANDELPIFCDPYPATTLAKRLLVEDEAFCQKALTTPPTPQQILRTNANGNIEWATLNSALQFGPVDLGSQPLTTTGAVNAGSINAAGAISAKTIAVTNTGSGNGISIQTENGTPFSIQSSKTNPAAGGTLNFFGATSDMEFNGASDGIFVFTNTSSQTTKANVFNGANFGINTLTPSEALDVNGKIKSNRECIVNGANIQYKFLSLRTNNLTRWDIGSDDTAESGANVGSDFFIHRFSDTGTFIDRVMSITRSNGYVGIGTNTPVNKLQVVGSFGRGAPVTKAADFTLSDTENWIIVNKGSSCTVTLPAASSWLGREFTIKVITAHTVVSASSNIVPANSATPGTNILSATAGAWATLVSDGTNWVIMANS